MTYTTKTILWRWAQYLSAGAMIALGAAVILSPPPGRFWTGMVFGFGWAVAGLILWHVARND